MIGIGIIGLGFMGMTHFEAARGLKRAKVRAIATRNQRKLAGDWSMIQGNFGPRGSAETDLTGISGYKDMTELLNDPEIDLVNVCLPTEKHEEVAIEAFQHGKHVLLEKPIAANMASAKKILKAAEKAEKRLLVAHVLPFFPEFRFAYEALEQERYGKLLSAHFRRVICPPDWSKDMATMEKVGGYGIDLHIHDNHFIRSCFGMPEAISATGLMENELVTQVHTLYHYPSGGPAISCCSGGLAAGGLKFAHGFELYCEDATIEFEAGTYGDEWVVNRPMRVISKKGRSHYPKLKTGSTWCAAFTSELQLAVDVIEKNRDPGPLEGSVAVDALKLCELEAKSIAAGKTVKVPSQ